MHYEVVNVTPEQAEHWLAAAAGIPQRALTRRKVVAFAGAMKRGQWRVTHQGVAIDPDGILIDGQHRLAAVVLSGETVPMSIAYDVPREMFDVIDTGTARTAASVLHIAGVPDANATSASVRLVLMYDQIAGTRRAAHGDIRSGVTSRDVLDFMESPRGAVLAGAIGPARSLAMTIGRIGMRSWMTAAQVIIDETEPDAQLRAEFIDKLHSGAMLAESSPLLTFRRWLMSETGYARSDRTQRGSVGVAAWIKTWNAWTFGRDLSVMRFRPGVEAWPIPGRDAEWLAAAEKVENENDAAVIAQ